MLPLWKPLTPSLRLPTPSTPYRARARAESRTRATTPIIIPEQGRVGGPPQPAVPDAPVGSVPTLQPTAPEQWARSLCDAEGGSRRCSERGDGYISLLTQLVDVLFDSGATHSFISAKLVETLGLNPTRKFSPLSIMLPDEKTVSCKELYEGYLVKMYECEFPIDLYRLELMDSRIILGMN